MDIAADTATEITDDLLLRYPSPEDGFKVHQLIKQCSPLDENSLYCNLLQCTHFSATSIAACNGEQIIGFVSGYIPPGKPNCLFIWQVAVAKQARGLGLGGKMLHALLQRPACANTAYIETTITPDNAASWALFRKFAQRLNAGCTESSFFQREKHFGGSHADEVLLRIGPLSPHLQTTGRKSQ